ncbi:MAG: radical SAM protein [Planctomycetota bacterium]
MIDPQQQWCIQIDVTNQCARRCSNCTRALAHANRRWHMTPNQFRLACRALRDFPTQSVPDLQGRKKVVGMIGGEPLLHPHFDFLCDIMTQEIPDRDRRGLWTSIHWEKRREAWRIRETFGYVNQNPHAEQKPSVHQPLLVAIADAIPCAETREKLIDACWVQRIWSSTINRRGFYFCEVAAALSDIFAGPDGLPVEPDCWRRPLSDFRYQRDWACQRCGCAIPLPPRVDAEERDDVSKSNLEALKRIGSRGVDRCVLFDTDHYDPQQYWTGWEPNRYLKNAPWPYHKIERKDT